MSLYMDNERCGHSVEVGQECRVCAWKEKDEEILLLRRELEKSRKELSAWKAGHLDSHRAEISTLKNTLASEIRRREIAEQALLSATCPSCSLKDLKRRAVREAADEMIAEFEAGSLMKNKSRRPISVLQDRRVAFKVRTFPKSIALGASVSLSECLRDYEHRDKVKYLWTCINFLCWQVECRIVLKVYGGLELVKSEKNE